MNIHYSEEFDHHPSNGNASLTSYDLLHTSLNMKSALMGRVGMDAESHNLGKIILHTAQTNYVSSRSDVLRRLFGFKGFILARILKTWQNICVCKSLSASPSPIVNVRQLSFDVEAEFRRVLLRPSILIDKLILTFHRIVRCLPEI